MGELNRTPKKMITKKKKWFIQEYVARSEVRSILAEPCAPCIVCTVRARANDTVLMTTCPLSFSHYFVRLRKLIEFAIGMSSNVVCCAIVDFATQIIRIAFIFRSNQSIWTSFLGIRVYWREADSFYLTASRPCRKRSTYMNSAKWHTVRQLY